MPTSHFYLKKMVKKTGRSLIFLQAKYYPFKFLYSTSETIKPINWDKKLERVKRNKETESLGNFDLEINPRLVKIEAAFQRAYSESLGPLGQLPHPDKITELMESYKLENAVKKPNFTDVYNQLAKDAADPVAWERIKRTHLDVLYPNLDFKDVTVGWLKQFVQRLLNGEHREDKRPTNKNSLQGDFTAIRSTMQRGYEKGYHRNDDFKNTNFKIEKGRKPDSVALTEDELATLFHLDINNPSLKLTPDKRKKLNEARDLFLVGAFTSLRVSDYGDIKPESITGNDEDGYILKTYSEKTETPTEIPIRSAVLKIFAKYPKRPNRLPEFPGKSSFNKNLKILCRLAGFNATGRKRTALTLPLWKCVASHTARKSWATWADSVGVDKRLIMKIMGQTTEAITTSYIKSDFTEAIVVVREKQKLSEHKF
jgi:integrase